MKKNLSNIDDEDKREMYESFVQSTFQKTDQEERTCEKIDKTHSLSFKKLAFLIETLNVIYPEGLNQTWEERWKYCIFKATDIFRSLKQGIQPKRGNPKKESGERVIVEESKSEDEVGEE